jgi:hypothetical protein
MTTLDDVAAIHILKTIAQARLGPDTPDLTPTPDLREALAAAFGAPSAMPASEGDLARAALAVLAEDAEFAGPIQAMSREVPASPQRYTDPATTIALTTAALLVLQTRIKVKGKVGDWALDIDKKAMGDGALKVLVERLLSLWK